MRFRLPTSGGWVTVAEYLLQHTREAPGVRERIEAGEVLLRDGTIVDWSTPYRRGEWVYLHRDLPDETPPPGAVTVLFEDENVVVADKPPFMATMPRGRHVVYTALIQLRRALALPDLAPAHRLDRLTAGVLLFTKRPAVRGAYQQLFARGEVAKTYLALAPLAADRPGAGTSQWQPGEPRTVHSRIVKERGSLQAREVPGPVNAVTEIQLLGPAGDDLPEIGLYRLTPRTGRTHQLRLHMCSLGLPIVGDPLYPTVVDQPVDEFDTPLQLLAQHLAFDDPLTGEPRMFTSAQHLPLAGPHRSALVAS